MLAAVAAVLLAAGPLPPPPPRDPAFCGQGTYILKAGENELGRETFHIDCRTDGSVVAGGHTEMKIAGQSLDTVLETDPNLVGKSLVASGTAGGRTLSQKVTVANGVATINSGDGQDAQQQPAEPGASMSAPNVFYPIALIMARYDDARGGVQSVPLLGLKAPATLERTGKDTAGGHSYLRLKARMGHSDVLAWLDDHHRMVAMFDPLQHFSAVREDTAADAAALIAGSGAGTASYAAPAGATFTAEEVSLPVKNFKLAGTLLLPSARKGKVPAVVLIWGSGQHDRDETIPMPGMESYKPFRQIAENLAAKGFAVLRCDKRGAGASTGLDTVDKATTTDFAADIMAQVDWLRARPEIDGTRVVLIGHSEGGAIAPMVAAADKTIAAIVLMAGPGKRGDFILMDQTRSALAAAPDLTADQRYAKLHEEETLLATVRAGGDLSSLPPEQLAMASSPWFKEFVTGDPLPVIRKVTQPMLILQGALDRQITAEQADSIESAAKTAGNKDVVKKVFPTLNHLFLTAKTGAFTEYSTLPDKNIPPDVLSALDDFLVSRLKP